MVVTGVAWLSSARVVKCWINFLNERNPHSLLPFADFVFGLLLRRRPKTRKEMQNFESTASERLEEGEDDVKSS